MGKYPLAGVSFYGRGKFPMLFLSPQASENVQEISLTE